MNTYIRLKTCHTMSWQPQIGTPADKHYGKISHSISDPIEHGVVRLAPRLGERILDVATGTGWTARHVAARGAAVTGIDLGADLIEAAKSGAAEARLHIDFQIGDAENSLRGPEFRRSHFNLWDHVRAGPASGVCEWEKRVPQTLQLYLEIALPSSRTCVSDDIHDALDYAQVVQHIQTVLSNGHFSLLETLAEHIAQIILKDFNAPWVKVSVAKL